jgi:hypothetical protein
MRVFQESDGSDYGRDALAFTLGAVGGLALGVVLSRRAAPREAGRRLGSELRQKARTVATRLRPARLRRMAVEQDELTQLEDSVLDAFLGDEVLSERGIDVGAISPGIIELSGSVWTQDEFDRATHVANGVAGVHTVVNRMDVEQEADQLRRNARRLDEAAGGAESLEHGTARTGGMGRRRQGRETDPDRPDDSQHSELQALERADREQWEDEGYADRSSESTERPEVQRADRTSFDEDELDNQDPHGKHAERTLDEPPQELNTGRRVGEGPKSGEHLILEHADVPVKPHGATETEGGDRGAREGG